MAALFSGCRHSIRRARHVLPVGIKILRSKTSGSAGGYAPSAAGSTTVTRMRRRTYSQKRSNQPDTYFRGTVGHTGTCRLGERLRRSCKSLKPRLKRCDQRSKNPTALAVWSVKPPCSAVKIYSASSGLQSGRKLVPARPARTIGLIFVLSFPPPAALC